MSVSTWKGIFLGAALALPLFPSSLPGQGKAPARRPFRRLPKLRTVYGVAPRGDKKIVIDGDVSDWPALRPIPLNFPYQVSGSKEYRGYTDLVGRAFLCWDDQALYAAVAVLDDFHRPLSRYLGGGWNPAGPVGDGIYLYFDPRRDTRSLGRAPERREDLEIWVGGLGKRGAKVLRIDRPAGTLEEAEGIRAGFRRTRNEKTKEPFHLWYEVKIPWKVLLPKGMTPRKGLCIGADVILEDFDDPLDALPQTRIGWTFADGPVLYPGREGSLILLDAPLPKGEKVQDPPRRPMPKSHEDIPGLEPALFYEDLSRALIKHPPRLGPPAGERLSLLQKLDRSLGNWPPLDLGLLVARYQRGMVREEMGLMDSGAPSFFKTRSQLVVDAMGKKAPPEGVVRLIRLPWSGWLLVSHFLKVVVDPWVLGLHHLAPKVDAAFLSNALDPARRDDPLSFGLLALKHPLVAHVPVILPRMDTSKLPRFKPGDGLNLGALEVFVLGPLGKNAPLPDQVGFEVTYLPAGPRLVFGGWRFDPSWLKFPRKRPANTPVPPEGVDLLVLPAGHPKLLQVLEAVKPRAFLPSDVLDYPLDPEGKADLRLEGALKRLKEIRNIPWALLGWGEEVEVVTGKGLDLP